MVLAIYIATLFISLLLILSAIITVLPILHGAPYVPSPDAKVKKMIELSRIKKGEKVADLGSGNGKIVIALALQGAEVHGFEINPFLVFYSRRKIKRLNLGDRAFIHLKSLWRQDYSSFDVITLYGVTYIMEGLEKKLRKELKKGSRVVSNYFRFPTWKAEKAAGGVLLYIR